MKVAFFLQRRFAYVGHALAWHLKQEAPETVFAAFTQTRASMAFLEGQNDVEYSSLILEEEIHKKIETETIDPEYLNTLEEQYGIPNLWPYLYIDRVIMHGQLRREYPYDKPFLSREQMLKKVQVTAKEVISFLDREKPDAVVFSVIGSVASLMLWHIAKKRGIRTVLVDVMRIDNRVGVTEEYKTFTWANTRFEELQDGADSPAEKEAEAFLERFRNKPEPFLKEYLKIFERANRLSNLKFLSPQNLVWSSYWHAKMLYKHLTKKDSDYSDILIWWQAWDKLKRRIRGLIGYGGLYSLPKEGERFAFYPLHVEPETALLLYAPYRTNQIELIRAAARSLPIDMMLYVEEHPEMVGYRPRSYYKEILKIPNVRLIDPKVRGTRLIMDSALVIATMGTISWEAVLLKKPLILFGLSPLNRLPFVKNCETIEDLPYIVKEQLETFSHDEKALVNYLAALIENSVPADYMNLLWYGGGTIERIKNDEGLKNLSRLLGRKIGCTR